MPSNRTVATGAGAAAAVAAALFLTVGTTSAQTWSTETPVAKGPTDWDQAFTWTSTASANSPQPNQDISACANPLEISDTGGREVTVRGCDSSSVPVSDRTCTDIATLSASDPGPKTVSTSKAFLAARADDAGTLTVNCTKVRNQTFNAGTGQWEENTAAAGTGDGAAGPSAPGIVESGGVNYGTSEFFRWIGQQQVHPFPHLAYAAPEPRKVRYCDCAAGGDYPNGGSDSNDGRTPSTAYQTFSKCLEEATNDDYTLVHVDEKDTWDIAGGCFDGFGLIDDSNLEIGDCKTIQNDGWDAVQDDHCWIMASSSGGQVTLNGTGRTTPSSSFLRFQPVTKRGHLLMNGFEIIADNPDAVGFTTVPFDSFQGGMISFFTKSGAVSGAVGSSGNLASCHEVSGTFIYGLESLLHTGTGSTGSSDSLSTQGGCTMAIYGSNGGVVNHTDSPNTPESIHATVQVGSAPDSSLLAEMGATPACAILSGLELQVRPTATNVNQVLRIGSSTSAGASNSTETYVISSYLNNQSDGSTSGTVTAHLGVTSLDAGGFAKLRMINSSFNNIVGTGAVPRGLDMQNTGLPVTAAVDIEMIGTLHGRQDSGARDSSINAAEFFNGASVVKWTDGLYQGPPGVPNAWRTPGCISQTPEEMQTCSDAQRVGAIVVSNMTNTTTNDQQVGAGFCADGATCKGYRTPANEVTPFCARGGIPNNITNGGRVAGYIDAAGGPLDAGRIF